MSPNQLISKTKTVGSSTKDLATKTGSTIVIKATSMMLKNFLNNTLISARLHRYVVGWYRSLRNAAVVHLKCIFFSGKFEEFHENQKFHLNRPQSEGILVLLVIPLITSMN